jgi:hypothetical protein
MIPQVLGNSKPGFTQTGPIVPAVNTLTGNCHDVPNTYCHYLPNNLHRESHALLCCKNLLLGG